jgi:hypothetical protein
MIGEEGGGPRPGEAARAVKWCFATILIKIKMGST